MLFHFYLHLLFLPAPPLSLPFTDNHSPQPFRKLTLLFQFYFVFLFSTTLFLLFHFYLRLLFLLVLSLSLPFTDNLSPQPFLNVTIIFSQFHFVCLSSTTLFLLFHSYLRVLFLPVPSLSLISTDNPSPQPFLNLTVFYFSSMSSVYLQGLSISLAISNLSLPVLSVPLFHLPA